MFLEHFVNKILLWTRAIGKISKELDSLIGLITLSQMLHLLSRPPAAITSCWFEHTSMCIFCSIHKKLLPFPHPSSFFLSNSQIIFSAQSNQFGVASFCGCVCVHVCAYIGTDACMHRAYVKVRGQPWVVVLKRLPLWLFETLACDF